MPMNRAGLFLNNRMNKSHILLQSLFILDVSPAEKLLVWQAGLWLAYFSDQKPSLPSLLLPWGECVSCSSVPPGLCVRIRAGCECFWSHSQPITWGQVRLGLVPDSWKSGQLQNLRKTPQRETVKYTSRTHYLFLSHFFCLLFASSNGVPLCVQTSSLQFGSGSKMEIWIL